MPEPLLQARPRTIDDDLRDLERGWLLARRKSVNLPAYEDVMLSGLGGADDRIMLLRRDDECWTILRGGRCIPSWFGKDFRERPLAQLAPDCRLAVQNLCERALDESTPASDRTHCSRDGFVQCYELLALPLENRWGPPMVGLYVGERGPRYSLVDAIFRSTDDGVVALAALRDHHGFTVDFQVVDLNAGAARLLQRSVEDLRWRRLCDGDHVFKSPEIMKRLRLVVETSRSDAFEVEVRGESRPRTLKANLSAMGDLVCVALTDVTDLKERERSSRLLFDHNPVPMWIIDPEDRRFLKVNDAACRHYGFSRAAFTSMRLDDLVPEEKDAQMEAVAGFSGLPLAGRSWHHVKADGSRIEVLTFARRFARGGSEAQLVAVIDITERRRAEKAFEYIAHHDPLTELPNRVLFHKSLENALSGQGEFALLSIDLDLFKNVNDSFGHPMGDLLLKEVAVRLRNGVSGTDLVARLGGDEFAVLLTSANAQKASAAARALVEVLVAPYSIESLELVVGASIGIALAPSHGHDTDDLLKKADIALYLAKSEGRGTYRFFEAGMDLSARQRSDLEADLRKAYSEGALELHYQPLVDVVDRRVRTCESLLRWNRNGVAVSPGEFIPVAESTGLIVPIGDWVLRTACAAASEWPEEVSVAVNLSPVQFKDRNLVQSVVGALSRSGLPAHRLELEITESVLLDDTLDNLRTLSSLKSLGVRISLDDFGTGYSSLSYLRRFAFDKLKVDRSFIKDIDDPDCRAIVRAIFQMARSLGIRTVAEGIETMAQLGSVADEGCVEAQGFLFGRAEPAELIRSKLCERPGRGEQSPNAWPKLANGTDGVYKQTKFARHSTIA